jgi:hypothetical protein
MEKKKLIKGTIKHKASTRTFRKFYGGGRILEWADGNAEKLIQKYLGVKGNEVFNQNELINKGDYYIGSENSGDGDTVFIDVCFGDEFEKHDNNLEKNYEYFTRYAEDISDNMNYDVTVMSNNDANTIMFQFTDWFPEEIEEPNDYADGGMTADGEIEYSFEYKDNEGDTYEDNYKSLSEAKKAIKEIENSGGRILETWKHRMEKDGTGTFVGRFAVGGEIEWGEDLGDGFSVGNDVYITDSKSMHQGKTGFVSGLIGKDLLVTISENGNERNVFVSKKGVEKLDAPEFAKGGKIIGYEVKYEKLVDGEREPDIKSFKTKEKAEEFAEEVYGYVENVYEGQYEMANGGETNELKVKYNQDDKKRGEIITPYFRYHKFLNPEQLKIRFSELYEGTFHFGDGYITSFLIKTNTVKKAVEMGKTRIKEIYKYGVYNNEDIFVVTGYKYNENNEKIPFTPSFMENTHIRNQYTSNSFKTKEGDLLRYDQNGDGYGFWYKVDENGKKESDRLKGTILTALFCDGVVILKENKMAEGGELDEEDSLDYNSISDLQSERNRLVRWKYQYNSKGADYKIKQLEERIEYLKSKDNKMAMGGKVKKDFKVGDEVIYAPNGKWFVRNNPNFKNGVITNKEIIGDLKITNYTIKINNGSEIMTSNTKEIELNPDKMADGGYTPRKKESKFKAPTLDEIRKWSDEQLSDLGWAWEKRRRNQGEGAMMINNWFNTLNKRVNMIRLERGMKEYAKGGMTNNNPSKKEIDDFFEYVKSFYGHNGVRENDFPPKGASDEKIKGSINVYMTRVKYDGVKWGGGDSMDRERVKQIMIINYRDKMAYGGMTPGRYYQDNKGQEFRFVGESEGKLLFKDGENVISKSEEDFEEKTQEKKLFKFFRLGGEMEMKEPEESQEYYASMQYDRGGETEVGEIKVGDWFYDTKKQLNVEVTTLYPNNEVILQSIDYNKNGAKNTFSIPLHILKSKLKGGNYFKIPKSNMKKADGGYIAKGGTFDSKVNAIAKKLEGKPVPAPYRKEYGSRYDKEDAQEAARRIVGNMRKLYGE